MGGPPVDAAYLGFDVQGSNPIGNTIYENGVSGPDVMYGRTDVCPALPLFWSIVQDSQVIG